MRVLRLFILFLGCCLTAQSQCPLVNFSLQASACSSESIGIQNSSAAGQYDWDYCTGDLNTTPTAQNLYTLSGAVGRPAMDIAKDGMTWYGFVTGTYTNTLYKLIFDNGLTNPPGSVQNLGDLSGLLNQPGALRIIKQAGNWFGLLHNTTTGEIIKLSFGNSLSNPLTTSVLVSGIGSANTGMAFGHDAVNGWVGIISIPGNQFQMVRLGDNLSVPTPADILTTSSVPNPNGLLDVDLIQSCGQWFGFASNLGNGNIYRLSFGTNLFQQPVIDQLTDLGGINGGRLRAMKEGDNYFLMVTSLGGSFFKISMGTDLNVLNPPVTNEGNFGAALQNSFGLAVAKKNSVWTISVVDQGSGKVSTVQYPNNCSVTVLGDDPASPIVKYTQAGIYQVGLTATNAGGISSSLTKSVTVSSLVAPDINFASQNVCANNNVNFTSVNTSGNLNSYLWNFGDAATSSNQNPSHVYTSASIFPVKLTVNASNGCNNFVPKSLKIYNAPIADFALPAVSPICTNQNYLLLNSSTSETGSNPTWEWRLNGALVSSQKDFTTTFTPFAQDIKLKALIPGCENEKTKTIPIVSAGPTVNFSTSDNCKGNSVLFSNTTTNADAGYVWTFDDGTTSTVASPSHIYLSPNTFQVTLTASNIAGCKNFLTKPVKIYSLPAPAFSIGLPPFSCSNSSTPFQNTTPALTDSNITSWNWQFGVPGSTSTLQQPSYTYASAGNYSVVLTATSDQSCTATLTKSVVIAASATADFTSGPSCINQSTKFSDASTGTIASRSWTIGTGTFTTTNPAYTFTSSGSFPTTLNVTSSNGCINVKTKATVVPVVPVQNFSMSNPCARKNAIFTDATSSPSDVVTAWNWNFDGNSATGNPAQFIFDVQGIFTTKLTTTHTSGCKYTLSRDVLINPTPTAGFTASPDRGGPPLTVQFINTSQQANSYAWKFFDKVTATSTRISPIYTFASLGNYSAELTATNTQGCSDVFSAPIIVLVPSIDLILKDFSLVNDAVTGKQKGQVTIFNNSNVPIVSVEVSMFLADKSVVNETITLNLNPGQVVSKALSFTLSSDQFDFNYLCAKINSEKDIQQDNNKRCINIGITDHFFRPYPNPSVGMMYVDWVSENAGSARLIVFDSMGKKSYEWETPSQAGLNQSVLDLTFLTCGMYYITIETSGGKSSARFIRQ